MARPRPSPPASRPGSSWLYGSNTNSCWSAGMPTPVSATIRRSAFPRRRAPSRTLPAGVNFIALSSSCLRMRRTKTGSQAMVARVATERKARPRRAASGANSCASAARMSPAGIDRGRAADLAAFEPRPFHDVLERPLGRAHDARQVVDQLAGVRVLDPPLQRPGHQAQRMQRLAQVMRDLGQEPGVARVGRRRRALCRRRARWRRLRLRAQVPHDAGEDPPPVEPGFADIELRRKGAAVLALGGDPPAGADHVLDAGLAVAPQIGVVPAALRLGHQQLQVLPHHLRGGIAEHRLGRSAEGGDDAGFVDGDDGVGDRVDDRGQARAMFLAAGFEPAAIRDVVHHRDDSGDGGIGVALRHGVDDELALLAGSGCAVLSTGSGSRCRPSRAGAARRPAPRSQAPGRADRCLPPRRAASRRCVRRRGSTARPCRSGVRVTIAAGTASITARSACSAVRRAALVARCSWVSRLVNKAGRMMASR